MVVRPDRRAGERDSASSDKENIGVCKDRGAAVPMGSKSFNADHALDLSRGRTEFQPRRDTCG